MQFTKLIIVITIAVLAIGCGTNRAISYGADIGDSILNVDVEFWVDNDADKIMDTVILDYLNNE